MYPKIKIWHCLCLLAFSSALLGCRQAVEPAGEEVAMAITLTSEAFKEGERIPTRFTCDGADLSPALSWSGVPQDAQSLALVVDDPDAPGRTFVHWVLYNVPAGQAGLTEGEHQAGIQGRNDFRRLGYNGPCPPPGSPHRYFFKFYALDTSLPDKEGLTKAEVLQAMQGHILAEGQLMGTYSR